MNTLILGLKESRRCVGRKKWVVGLETIGEEGNED